MGEGGWLSLINATPYTWHRGYFHSYDMSTWNFPDSVSPGELAQVYIERDGSGPDAAAEVNYTIADPDTSAIQIQYRLRDNTSPTTNVHFETINTISTPERESISTGFVHNVATPFILAGESDSFMSNDAPVDWMHQSLEQLGCLPLRHICIPGSHDSGMSTLGGKTLFADKDNTLTQKMDMYLQLKHGARYFDIRPVKASGVFKTGHYSGVEIDLGPLDDFGLGFMDDLQDAGHQGGNGQSIDDIINQLNDFTEKNKELVILKLSHAFDTDNGYEDLSQDQWDKLFDQMSRINYLFEANTGQDLTTLPLAAFIKDSAAVVVIVDQGDVDLKKHARNGFFKPSQFDIFDSFADTDEDDEMIKDQIGKLKKERMDPDTRYFLLSFTLTQQLGSSLGVPGKSILDLADKVFPKMFEKGSVWDALTSESYPNVIMVDSLPPDGRLKAFALAINLYFAPKVEGLDTCSTALSARSWKRSTGSFGWLRSIF